MKKIVLTPEAFQTIANFCNSSANYLLRCDVFNFGNIETVASVKEALKTAKEEDVDTLQ